MMKSIKWIGVALVLGLTSPAVHVEAAKLLKCSAEEIAAAQSLAAQVLALSKTDASAALKIAEDVAANKPKCFQVAFGAFLDGKGVASKGRGKGKGKGKDKDDDDNDGCKKRKNCPPSRS